MTPPQSASGAPQAPARDRSRVPRRLAWWIFALAVAVPLGWFAWAWLTYPSDRTPEGAYLRVVTAVNRGRPEEFFAYLEEPAQHAAFTIRDYRKKALERVRSSYPEDERKRLEQEYGPAAAAEHGKDLFAVYARDRGFLERMRKDMSGIDRVEMAGERATVVTARGTRYAFRRRPNGIWGLTLFTPTLVAEAERAARDLDVIERAAADYERAGNRGK